MEGRNKEGSVIERRRVRDVGLLLAVSTFVEVADYEVGLSSLLPFWSNFEIQYQNHMSLPQQAQEPTGL